MPEGKNDSQFGRWSVEGRPAAIEYSRSAMEVVRIAVVEGFYKLPRGGLEVGGVLFGHRIGHTVRVLASRPLECEHATGPSFVLSDKDESALTQLLQSAEADPELEGMAPVGWYHSHTRSGICLSEQDQQIYDCYFPEPWQIALVLHPQKTGPTRAGFFFREEEGRVRRESSYQEFDVAPLPKAAKPAPPAAKSAPEPEITGSDSAEARPRSSGRVSWLLFAIAWCIAAAAVAFALRDYWLPGPPAPVALHLSDAAGQLTISWEHSSSPVRQAEAGVLEIFDGGRTSAFRLDREQIREGSFTYVRRSGDIRARLEIRLAEGKSVGGVATFAGRPVEPPPVAAAEAGGDREQLLNEIQKLRADLEEQSKRNRDLEAAAAASKKRRKTGQ